MHPWVSNIMQYMLRGHCRERDEKCDQETFEVERGRADGARAACPPPLHPLASIRWDFSPGEQLQSYMICWISLANRPLLPYSAALVSSAFIVGVLFTSLLWDATILFPSERVTEATLESIEAYYLTWWNGAMTVKVFLHLVVSPSPAPARSLQLVAHPLRFYSITGCHALPLGNRQVCAQVRHELLL